MKNILIILFAFAASGAFAQNLIDNPDFEIGPTSTNGALPPGYCPSWQYGCQTQFPFPSTQVCSPDLYDINGIYSCWLTNVLLPRQNGQTNNRYIHMFPFSTYESGESIKGDINQSLSTIHSYEVSCYVAREWNSIPPNSNSTWVQNPNLKLEFVLRKDNDCSIEKIVYTSSDITNYFYHNGCDGSQSTDWRLKTGQFNLTQNDVNIGYNKLEIRIKGLGMALNSVFIDDVSLIEIDKVSADFHFTNPNQTNITLNSVYGPMPVTQICQTFPNTCVTIDGSASQNEDRYHIEITPWDLNGWAPSGPALFDNWVCIGCTVGPKNLCDLTILNGSSFQPNVVYKVTLGVGIPWDDETHFIIIRPTSQLAPIADQTICSGNQATFNVSTSNWPVQVFDGTTLVGTFNSNPIILNPNSTTTYTFVPSNKYECKEKRRATVTIETSPETRITGPNVFCLGDPLTFTGTLVAGFSLQHLWQIQKCDQNGNVLAGSVEYTTPWLYGSFPEIFTYTGSTTNMPANYLQPGYYRIKLVTLSAATNGCWGVTYKTIKILPTPIVNFQYPNDLDYLCNGESISFYVDQASFPVTVFEGTNPIAIFVSNPIIVSPTSTTTYTFTPDSDSKVICSTTQTIVVENCPKPCFEINDVQSQFEEESQYGPMIVNKICLPNEVIIDGSCSEYENGYHIRICEFDIGSWSFILPNLYSGWVSGSGNIPSSINLTSLVNSNGFNFSTGVVYLVAISTGSQWPGGPTWTSSLPQFFTLDYCTKSGAKINSTKGLVKTNSLSVYPNPTNGQLSVQLDKMDRGEMMVYSLDGKLLVSESFTEAIRLKVDLSEFESGTYIIKINTSNNSFTKKIVKE